MSVISTLMYHGLKVSGFKKVFSLPEGKFLQKVAKINQSRQFFLPTDNKAHYHEQKIFDKYSCLVIQSNETPSERAILFFFGGGMMIGPDKGDIGIMRKLAKNTGCDVWFPYYPLCTDYCITESYRMSFECYRQMLEIYGAGNVSTCGFSSGGALAIGMASHNNAIDAGLAQPRHIVAVSPGEVPWNEAECARMQALNARDVMIDYVYMKTAEGYMRHGEADVQEYMIHLSKGNLAGVDNIHFFYSEDEVLYGAWPEFRAACVKYGVKYTITSRPKMLHCYAVQPLYREGKEDFQKICAILAQ